MGRQLISGRLLTSHASYSLFYASVLKWRACVHLAGLLLSQYREDAGRGSGAQNMLLWWCAVTVVSDKDFWSMGVGLKQGSIMRTTGNE